MTRSVQLLIVSHTPSANTRTLTDAVMAGAQHDDISGVTARCLRPPEADAKDVLRADGIILGTTENFGYMSGALKDFFERIYYPCLEKTEGLPYGLFIRAGNDGLGAQSSIERIVTGLNWKRAQEPLLMVGEYQDHFVDDCKTLGMTIAAGLELGVL